MRNHSQDGNNSLVNQRNGTGHGDRNNHKRF